MICMRVLPAKVALAGPRPLSTRAGAARAPQRSSRPAKGVGVARPLRMRVRASGEDESPAELLKAVEKKPKRRQADSTDAVATFMTRRFGIAGGLAWLGVLTFGVVSEQLKTRRENYVAERDTREVTNAKEVRLASGVAYTDKVIGGGEAVAPGMLVGVSYTLSVNGELVFDASKRPQVIIYGGKKGGGALCAGVLEALGTMRAGGRRVVTVPSAAAFGEDGLVTPTGKVPPGATVTYDISVPRVSIPPS